MQSGIRDATATQTKVFGGSLIFKVGQMPA
jgi:hypothetical protein